ncbi:MAG: FadR family transcriptional regulator [Candidatus Accumulibacter sp.]|jgi:GntR family transcriptional repressor for pyruvate dehydrogenase complex|nr:FadR family transcriptional regulator [Accumulibacter sp.]
MRHVQTHSYFSIPVRKSEPLAQQVSRIILAGIQTGAFAPGDKLPSEAELARKYGISRTIVREALASLKNDNILESKQGKGITVKDPNGRQAFRFSDVFATISQAEVNHLYEMRAILESEAAGLAAIRMTDEDRKSIERGLEELALAVREGKSGEEGHNLYNEAIAKASHNPMLIEFLGFLQAKLRNLSKELRLNTMMSPERARMVLQEHKNIADAIFSGDPAAARKAVLDHLTNAAGRAGLSIYAACPESHTGRFLATPGAKAKS